MASFLHSKEGMTQGDPLAMIVYRIGILPLINNLKHDIPDVIQPWYADKDIALGTSTRIETYLNSLTRQGLGRGYYTELSKSVLIAHPENLESRNEFGARHGLKVCKGACYLWGYIGDDKSNSNWLRERMLTWEENINRIRKIAGKYPH